MTFVRINANIPQVTIRKAGPFLVERHNRSIFFVFNSILNILRLAIYILNYKFAIYLFKTCFSQLALLNNKGLTLIRKFWAPGGNGYFLKSKSFVLQSNKKISTNNTSLITVEMSSFSNLIHRYFKFLKKFVLLGSLDAF